MAVIPPISYKIEVKRAIVQAFRTTFHAADFYSELLKKSNITIEYPTTPEQYPAIIVGFKEQQLRSAGIGHAITDNNNLVYTEWVFIGEITLDIMALTSVDRDYISDAVINLLSFGRVEGYSFRQYVEENNSVNMILNVGSILPTGENTMSGASWGLTDTRVYQCGYSFGVFGQFKSDSNYYDLVAQVEGDAFIGGDDLPESNWTGLIDFNSNWE